MIARERLLGLAQHIGGAHTATNQRSWFGSLSIEVAVSSLIGPPSWCTESVGVVVGSAWWGCVLCAGCVVCVAASEQTNDDDTLVLHRRLVVVVALTSLVLV
mgnify:CR=1 FL=1